ncbi:glyceraldehyde 3-phosphate dehydrogenase NAD-binding domain-containing protein [Janthinobacterium fluminis]|uniref:Glyceraldehyde 3-phosphate dehydrogenase N-terminal domain-containing protein n=1 Tax=Janthinobacterium fluminis TaxID=2987524 RepID=A0ABT5K0P1_9BURK|nr:glyceraldehyde 3-phosphate dehydrogenase NAD-binding domain-containing protein [Janthinobacterium fluminis]MDC8757871.1 glyceraldehyde 3-phosphate dehydrogenase N-terminal domain-containing protein [Janthinobacterium fluminis]
MSDVTAGINGFGRFGLHLLRAWLDRPDAPRLAAINDDYHDLDAALRILAGDAKVSFADCAIGADGDTLVIHKRGQAPWRIAYSHGPARQAPWRGQTDWWLECSGAHPTAQQCRELLGGRTRRALLSATCDDADQTLVFGYNEATADPAAEIISYGSCTVNAFVPLAHWLHGRYGVGDASVSVIHNVAPARLATLHQPERRTCTLERMGPRLLPFLAPQRFFVDYVLIPYTGVSLIDFRFRLNAPGAEADLLDALDAACRGGELAGLYRLAARDDGPQAWQLSPESAVLLRSRARLAGDTLSLPAYFDNENSAVRYLDLLTALVRRRD